MAMLAASGVPKQQQQQAVVVVVSLQGLAWLLR